MSDDSEIIQHLKRTNRLLAILVTKDIDQQKEKIEVLNNAGFQPTEIAEFLDTTANTVNVALSAIRKAKKTGGRKSRKK